jgi:hypothetical protein
LSSTERGCGWLSWRVTLPLYPNAADRLESARMFLNHSPQAPGWTLLAWQSALFPASDSVAW